jgi:hypothetical protein
LLGLLLDRNRDEHFRASAFLPFDYYVTGQDMGPFTDSENIKRFRVHDLPGIDPAAIVLNRQ